MANSIDKSFVIVFKMRIGSSDYDEGDPSDDRIKLMIEKNQKKLLEAQEEFLEKEIDNFCYPDTIYISEILPVDYSNINRILNDKHTVISSDIKNKSEILNDNTKEFNFALHCVGDLKTDFKYKGVRFQERVTDIIEYDDSDGDRQLKFDKNNNFKGVTDYDERKTTYSFENKFLFYYPVKALSISKSPENVKKSVENKKKSENAKKQNAQVKTKKTKTCPKGEVLNTLTNRCIKIGGTTYKKLVKDGIL